MAFPLHYLIQNKKEGYFLAQGIEALTTDATSQRNALIEKLQTNPDDINVQMIIEYHDKRIAELASLKKRITATLVGNGL